MVRWTGDEERCELDGWGHAVAFIVCAAAALIGLLH